MSLKEKNGNGTHGLTYFMSQVGISIIIIGFDRNMAKCQHLLNHYGYYMDVGFTILYIFLDLLGQKNEYLQFRELTKQAALSFRGKQGKFQHSINMGLTGLPRLKQISNSQAILSAHLLKKDLLVAFKDGLITLLQGQ